ncbi:integrase [Candidatus Thiosymbion oneisti]|uniref:integrase n=1 Tax=Candidatus Thiosymbion oneisti TaxID=589554 RepID=UPI001061DCBB|nr:integrase [Candidatus Thiosymbion oneisti]
MSSAGADDEKAKAAARALADYESSFNRIDSDLRVLKWMVGAILAGVVSLVIKGFFV